ncbi:helix-turn-helix domain-containing protein [Hymenobacter crusticola]|uniref:AraC family transcriptional regulator n=1 Tax=Hymenobacter crusticola TaxID=1770526 RepID=A0A243WIU6_9BACT|nr:AraC family transcriptional regulator [Hymenobacter crusticola]OUJ75796.1 AraC family transcriptional regulator [Hymenobacter crusticola]
MKVISFKIPKSTKDFIRYQVDDQPYFYDKLHQHPEIQLSYVLEGEGKLIGGDYIGLYRPGDLFLLGHDVPHVFRSNKEYYSAASNLRSHAVLLFFDSEVFTSGFYSIEELQGVKKFFEQLTGCYRIHGAAQEAIARHMLALPQTSNLERVLMVLQIVQLLMQPGALQCLNVTDQMHNLNEREGKRMEQVLHFLMEQSHRPITLGEVASVANMSREAFCRFFKERTRKTYVHYLNELRVTNVCQLLLHTEQTIASAAYACGFANLSYFNRVFFGIMGKTPREYRENQVTVRG